MAPSKIVTLLTDFGTEDPFVGVMKGVILSRFAGARIVDLCHHMAPQDVRQGAFWLARCHPFFPTGTVHVAVVDPGVGSERAALAVRAAGHVFVVPDNGLVDDVLRRHPAEGARRIDLGMLRLPEPSRTFHGRDVFAPVAAELASGRIDWSDVGPPHELEPKLAAVAPIRGAGWVEGEVVSVDHFGNLITNLDAELVDTPDATSAVVGGRACPLRGTYADVAMGECVAVVGSFGTIEIAVRQASAAALLGAGRGAKVRLVSRSG